MPEHPNALSDRDKLPLNRPEDLSRNAEEMKVVSGMLGPFHRAGYVLFPLGRSAKVPRDKGWLTNRHTVAEIKHWLEVGGNVGVLLADDDIVLDVDPRNGGETSFARLQADLNIDLTCAPTILSGRGDGGRHYYWKKPTDLPVCKGLARYPGIDGKTRGGFVLAPGSRHPETGGLYVPDSHRPAIGNVSMAPAQLLDLFRKPKTLSRAGSGGGELSSEQVEKLLTVLDPRHYGAGHYENWFKLAASCHDATRGGGLEVWLEWAAHDPAYGSEVDADRNIAMWNSLKSGKAGGVSYLHLLAEVARAGRLDLVLAVEPTFVFEGPGARRPQFSRSPQRLDRSAFNPKRSKS